MVWTTVLFGGLLLILGVIGYFVTDQTFWPALIPGLLGLSLLITGLVGFKQAFRRNAMHAAVLLTLLGLVGTVQASLELVKRVLEKPGLLVESATAILCGVFMGLAIRSFIVARRRGPTPDQPPAEPAPDATQPPSHNP